MIDFRLRKERIGSHLLSVGLLTKPLGIMISVSMIIAMFTITGSMIYAQNSTNTIGPTQTAENTANQTEATVDNSTQGIQTAINQTGQFLGNLSETVAENPVVVNATRETREFFADKSK